MRKFNYSKYNITKADYDKLWVQQKGMCAICGSNNNGDRLVIDHDHKTNNVRGLLCQRCNSGIGFMKDNTDILRGALLYLNAQTTSFDLNKHVKVKLAVAELCGLHALNAIARCNGNKVQAAAEIGVNLRTLFRYLANLRK